MHARRAILALASARAIPRKARWLLLRAAGVRTDAWNIAPGCHFTGPRVTIGRGTFINRGCVFDASASVLIGERCAFGLEVMILTSTHDQGPPDRRAGALASAPITVGDGCWIGSRALLLPGVTVGDGAIIAAGAVVHADCDPHTLYAGVPARSIRHITEGSGA
jgi:maltose O-acetyltransferase